MGGQYRGRGAWLRVEEGVTPQGYNIALFYTSCSQEVILLQGRWENTSSPNSAVRAEAYADGL